jgi:ketosteroid isomerase-like protein
MLASLLLLSGCASGPNISNDELKRQVGAAERDFAATMKARDHAGFVRHVAQDAIFFNGATALHGKKAIGDFWRKFYEAPSAPFSWEPDQVEVLASGKLAASSGPVYGPDGKLISRFNSIWRLEDDGAWRVVFDKGESVCRCLKDQK